MGQRPVFFAVLGTDKEYIYGIYMHKKEGITADKKSLISYIADKIGDVEDLDVYFVKLKMKKF